MKGIVFTELIEMVEQDLGIDIADRMIAGAETSNHGAYTSVGTYDHGELIRLVVSLSQETGTPVADLVRAFGRHLFGQFSKLYPQFFQVTNSSLDFLPRVESYIHVEVRKLYPDAQLPSFECQSSDGQLQMVYRSARPFADLAEGLILASVDYFQDDVQVQREDLGAQDGTHARFTLAPTPVVVDGRGTAECLT